MANFDSNKWYQLSIGLSASHLLSMCGMNLSTTGGDPGLGAAYFGATNSSDASQQWQIHPVHTSTTYVLRTKASGPQQGYLGTQIGLDETTPGSTWPRMAYYGLSDTSMYWQIAPWGDGTFYMTNAANGTEWHLESEGNGHIVMSSDGEARNNQAFSFKAMGEINDAVFSTVDAPGVTVTSTPSTAPASPPASSTSAMSTNTSTAATTAATPAPSTTAIFGSAASGSRGLSTGASAATGASVGAIALAAIIIMVWFLLRRRRRAAQQAHGDVKCLPQETEGSPTQEVDGSRSIQELPIPNSETKYELAVTPSELCGDEVPERIVEECESEDKKCCVD
ncbi:uncharacterized protein BDZ99DRAFT_496960 [Mytilinidion resinicola]|uniref:Ricin B lectin domain-containing protein n=1 Tax=Mytilinidion resinicola TaxID=574789 RepID=A0A6A6YUX7_9PEZI|nr:uncharacterized protein BDZ99DRAFT_496960 [Mytilinidion resinicola]KAF2812570.1 hypothetical protein BDZ99DRAFT_496960 [Mytilinidion resinicola]